MDKAKPFHSEIYAQEMAREAALWDPEPVEYARVRVGDIGYTRHGVFHRVGNAIDGTSPHVPRLDVGQNAAAPYGRLLRRVRPALSLQAHMMQTRGAEVGVGMDIAPAGACISFTLKSTSESGASLLTSNRVVSEDAIPTKPAHAYMRDAAVHAAWTRAAADWDATAGCSVIFLVTGCHLASAWAVTAFHDESRTRKAEAHFTPGAFVQGGFSFWGEWKTAGPVHASCGPPGGPGKENQCVFLCRVVRKERAQWRVWAAWRERRMLEVLLCAQDLHSNGDEDEHVSVPFPLPSSSESQATQYSPYIGPVSSPLPNASSASWSSSALDAPPVASASNSDDSPLSCAYFPSMQWPSQAGGLAPMPACTRCKGLKMKCTYGPGQAICTRCVNDGQECLLSSRRPRFAVHRHPKATPSVEGVKVRTPQATASVDTLSSDDMDGDSTPLFTPDDGGLAPMPACTRCKELKMKCTYDPEHATCTRCINGGHECRIPSNGQRLPVRTQLLQPARTEEAVMETLRASESIALPVDDKDESDSNSDRSAFDPLDPLFDWIFTARADADAAVLEDADFMRLKLLSGEVGHWRAPTISNMLGEAHAAGHVQLVVDSDQVAILSWKDTPFLGQFGEVGP